jgi:hypothetical protein
MTASFHILSSSTFNSYPTIGCYMKLATLHTSTQCKDPKIRINLRYYHGIYLHGIKKAIRNLRFK